MARPKEKFHNPAFLDKSERERSRLKLTLAKQMQKDIGRMLDEEVHSDLEIIVGNRAIPVHRFFIKTRSKRIYERLLELSSAESHSRILTMPAWLDYDTMIILFHQLYNVNSVDGEIDEVDIAAGHTMVDYLLSLLTEKKPDQKEEGSSDSEEEEEEERSRKEGHCMNGEVTLKWAEPAGGQCAVVNGTSQKKDVCVKMESNENVEDEVRNCVRENVALKDAVTANKLKIYGQETVCEHCNSDKSETAKNEEDLKLSDAEDLELSDAEDVVEETHNLSELIKMSYDITVPYDTCSVMGEDLLRGYLQNMDYDCIITVSDVHFKAHRSLLTARSAYFEAMLSGSWMESDSHEIKLEGVTPAVMEQTLLYLYGGVTDIIESCTISELIMVADMYGLEGLRDVVLYNLRRDYCHFFHKPCAVCEVGVVDTFSLAVSYNMAEIQERCAKWINNNRVKVWRTKAFASLPPEHLEVCYNAAVSSLNILNVLEVMLECHKLNRTIPHLKWCETVLHYITLLMDSAIEFTSQNFDKLINSEHFMNLDKGLAFKICFLEELFESVVKSLSLKTACGAYVSLTQMAKNLTQIQEEVLGRNTEEFEKFISSLVKMCENFLKMHIHQVINTENWDILSEDLQTHLRTISNFVCVEGFPKSRRAPPKLTSMLEKSNANKLSNEKLASHKTVKDRVTSASTTSRVFTHKQESVAKQETTSKRLTQKLGSGTKGSQSNRGRSPHGSTDNVSSKRGSLSETESVSEAEVEIMLVDIPLEPVNLEVAQRAVLPDSIHHIEQIQPILIWNNVSSGEW
ncbi:BTB/POZ domain-containing protein 8-like [Ostrea edulis]|uniref:BTB/POZ domain-containing protein 8-like n=1 Tax=Ostrea edulis TaxID=37623 RepID=UPI002095F08F|nr:BTB/POZ domain-containing protein 8-like [Ostrea edulis]XP_048772509.1 BTB/POZ domain-containing protein 8-like [Ostrea edulis]